MTKRTPKSLDKMTRSELAAENAWVGNALDYALDKSGQDDVEDYLRYCGDARREISRRAAGGTLASEI